MWNREDKGANAEYQYPYTDHLRLIPLSSVIAYHQYKEESEKVI